MDFILYKNVIRKWFEASWNQIFTRKAWLLHITKNVFHFDTLNIYTYIYKCVHVCVCMCVWIFRKKFHTIWRHFFSREFLRSECLFVVVPKPVYIPNPRYLNSQPKSQLEGLCFWIQKPVTEADSSFHIHSHLYELWIKKNSNKNTMKMMLGCFFPLHESFLNILNTVL